MNFNNVAKFAYIIICYALTIEFSINNFRKILPIKVQRYSLKKSKRNKTITKLFNSFACYFTTALFIIKSRVFERYY